ncbi:MAG: peptide chain release factor N(5)-glutamine methyltransferase [Cyanobacteriota bacterium]
MLEPNQIVSGLELWQWRNASIQSATAADIAPMEVDWLLQTITSPIQLSLTELEQLWQKRLNDRLPVQYIAGMTSWRKFQLTVNPGVLIPRPETEMLIDLAIAAADDNMRAGHWADLGTGSGAIAFSIAEVLTNATIHGVDISPAALTVAQTNAKNLGFGEQIQFYHGSWWQPLEFLKGQFSGMISNPPYIPSDTVLTLQPEVVKHEPHLALDGGADGLDHIRHLITVSPDYLRPGGVWLVEMMAGQAETVAELLENHGSYSNISIHADLAGIERFAIACKKVQGMAEKL